MGLPYKVPLMTVTQHFYPPSQSLQTVINSMHTTGKFLKAPAIPNDSITKTMQAIGFYVAAT